MSSRRGQTLRALPALVVLVDRPRWAEACWSALPAVAREADALILRDKESPPRKLLAWVLRIKERVPDAALWVDGSLSVALASEAAGLHLPAAHVAASTMRSFWPGWISAAAHDAGEALWHREADCLIWGHAFMTRSKPGLFPRQTLSEVVQATTRPVLAIGGINAENCCQLSGLGLSGVVVGDGVWLSPDPAAAARSIREAVLAPSWRAGGGEWDDANH
ncbi:MAG: thiamine phosphate synthase [Firmicutes bacterium]|nr:thiamine phosphate synthase [Bacillota bacterium]